MKKLRSKKGFTLSELLVAVGILALIVTALSVAMPIALRAYTDVTAKAEAGTLSASLATAITDELHLALDVRPDGSYRSQAYGRNCSITAVDGRITAGGYALLGEKSYTSGLEADVTVTYHDGLFSVSLQVTRDGHVWSERQFTVRPINES